MRRQTARQAPKLLFILYAACNKYRPEPRWCHEPQNPQLNSQSERTGGKRGRMRRELWPQTDTECTLLRPLDGSNRLRSGEKDERSDATDSR